MAEQTQDESPEIRIDRNGVWYYRNMEMTRIDIVHHFYQHLLRDDQGYYQIELNHERCRIQVEDVPYVIRSVSSPFEGENGLTGGMLIISLSDGCREELDPETIRIGEGEVLYCRVKKNEHAARFSRQAYYQLAKYIEYDPQQDRYFMIIGDRSYNLGVNQPIETGGSHVR